MFNLTPLPHNGIDHNRVHARAIVDQAPNKRKSGLVPNYARSRATLSENKMEPRSEHDHQMLVQGNRCLDEMAALDSRLRKAPQPFTIQVKQIGFVERAYCLP